ncbi:MAG: inositol monophosphatase family protein [Akkermansiaceae bacterium]|nr:inositol monophosphatase family protein [Akkermansiaceae bacterium]MDG1364593.1 inositol monophosphatase family protein [Akkermansiaceae bacterium]
MELTSDQLSELESIGIEAATRAGEMIQSKAKNNHKVVHKKGGNSLASQIVTAIDLESQRLILETLNETFKSFELGLLTEESPDDSSRHQHDYFWCIDPLDGTLAFTKGTAGYSVSIALISRHGNPLIGIVFDPYTSTLYHAIHRQGAQKNGVAWGVPTPSSVSPLTLMIDNSFITRADDPTFRDQLVTFAKQRGFPGTEIINHAGAVLNACWVVDHAPSLYFKFPKPNPGGGSIWDFAATTCLFSELGLPASDIHGAPLQLNPIGKTYMNRKGILFASSSRLAKAAINFFH